MKIPPLTIAIIGMLLAAVVAAGLFYRAQQPTEPTPVPAEEPTAIATIEPTAQATPDGDTAPAAEFTAADEANLEAVTDTAAAYITASYTYSWQDAATNAWVEQAAQYATPRLAAKLRADYGGQVDGGMSWDEIQQAQRERKVDVSEVALTPWFKGDARRSNTAKRVTVMVYYSTPMRDNAGPRAGVGWSVPLSEYRAHLTLVKTGESDDSWRVAVHTDVAAGG